MKDRWNGESDAGLQHIFIPDVTTYDYDSEEVMKNPYKILTNP